MSSSNLVVTDLYENNKLVTTVILCFICKYFYYMNKLINVRVVWHRLYLIDCDLNQPISFLFLYNARKGHWYLFRWTLLFSDIVIRLRNIISTQMRFALAIGNDYWYLRIIRSLYITTIITVSPANQLKLRKHQFSSDRGMFYCWTDY